MKTTISILHKVVVISVIIAVGRNHAVLLLWILLL